MTKRSVAKFIDIGRLTVGVRFVQWESHHHSAALWTVEPFITWYPRREGR